MNDMELRVEYVPIDAVTPYERNTRRHAEEDVSAIKASIEQFGFLDPIGVWHGTIVEGHGRLLAAKELGLKEIPIIRLDGLTDEQRRAYAIAHNKTAELSEWDDERLNMEMEELDYDWSAFGFNLELVEDASRFSSSEIDVDSFSDEEFEYECPECGFKFNA